MCTILSSELKSSIVIVSLSNSIPFNVAAKPETKRSPNVFGIRISS